MNELPRKKKDASISERITCPSCSHEGVLTLPAQHSFAYGDGPEAVELTVTVNVRRCASCGFEFLDDAAEDAKHEAICRHLGVLGPAEIRALRERCGMSRAQFSQLTKIGEATLGRWERGALIQTAAYDQFLFLLQFQDNRERLSDRGSSAETLRTRTNQNASTDSKRFRVLQNEVAVNVRLRAARFRLYNSEAA